MRGVGAPSGLDTVTLASQQVQKTAKNGLSNASSSLSSLTLNASSVSGSVGGDGAHAHGPYITSSLASVTGGSAYHAVGYAEGNLGSHGHGHSLTAGAQSLSSGTAAAQTISGDNETRPINKGVNYIIKI